MIHPVVGRRGRNTDSKNHVPQSARLCFDALEDRVNPAAFYIVPGAAGTQTSLDFSWASRDAANWNEIGVYAVRDGIGTVGTTSPTAAGYARAALTAAVPVFVRGESAGARRTLTFEAGTVLAFYLAQNTTTATIRQANPTNAVSGPVAFLSAPGAQQDGFDHTRVAATAIGQTIAFEDQLFGGDQDFNDAVIHVAPSVKTLVPGASGQRTPTAFRLESRQSASTGEIGIYLFDSADGTVNGVRPGEAGYAQTVIRDATKRILFPAGSAPGAVAGANLPAAGTFGFYMIPNGTSAEFLQSNAGNNPAGRLVAFFSPTAANPDGIPHIRHNGHVVAFEDQLFGGDQDFNDAVISFAYGAPSGEVTGGGGGNNGGNGSGNGNGSGTGAPTITAALLNDTGTADDRVTTNPTVRGTVTDSDGIATLEARLGQTGSFTSIRSALNGSTYTITAAQLRELNGDNPLTDGVYTVQVRATDNRGNAATPTTLRFTLDREATTTTLQLAAASDTGIVGEGRTETGSVTLTGTAEAGSTVRLERRGVGVATSTLGTTKADTSGNYSFTSISLDSGPNGFKVIATDGAGNTSDSGITLTRNRAPQAPTSPNQVTGTQGGTATVDLSTVFTDPDSSNQTVRIDTVLGSFNVQLFDTQTPRHAQNFVGYAQGNAYDNMFIHRSEPGFVVQGGGFRFQAGSNPNFTPITPNASVQNEPGLPNSRGTLALAKQGGDPNSGTSQWFVNLADNTTNLDNQNGGFTVFGQVIGDGQKVADAIAAVPRFDRSSENSAFGSIPLRDFTGTTLQEATADNYVLVSDVAVVGNPLTFATEGITNPGLLTATLTNNTLTLNFIAGQTGTATLTVRATDLDGASTTHTFVVTVT